MKSKSKEEGQYFYLISIILGQVSAKHLSNTKFPSISFYKISYLKSFYYKLSNGFVFYCNRNQEILLGKNKNNI